MRPLLSLLPSLVLSDSANSSARSRHRRATRRRFAPRRLHVEALEERAVPSTLAIAGASAIEGGTAYRYTDAFVAPNAYGLAAARDLQVGPDGNVYVASHDTDVVKVFEGGTGRFLRDLSAPSGELDGPWAMTFGPDGRLYVSGRYSHDIVSFDIGSGASDVFVGTASGGLAIPWGIAFGPDGNLYASSHIEGPATPTDTVKEYSGSTGAYLGDFVAAGSGGLDLAGGIAFGPDGSLYVANRSSGDVKRYNGQTGAFLGNFVPGGSGGLVSPTRLLFHTDGYLYVSDQSSPNIFRYNATTGAFADVFASNLSVPASGMAFAPSGEFYLSQGTATLQPGSLVGRMAPSSFAAFTVSLDAASTSPVSVSFATADGTALAGRDYGAWSGTVSFAPGETTRTILVATLNDNGADPTRAFTVSLSSPVNATLGRSQGLGTILDDTKFYTVDGGSDSTYQYASSGTALGSNALGSGDTAPHGVATTAAGTTEWVVDANKNVYVYNTGGALLGSWSAGGLSSSATLTGVATNGTDLWLVDSSSDKVYKYAGAASRLSGSQIAGSSFSLANKHGNNNTNPQDIVTDGTSFWVVDGSALKVFKYTLSGSLLGSWAIDPADAHPTGLTINPNNVSDVWIVDSGTLKVYQYVGAAGRTSGSQSAAVTFALNPSDTNPQGIADPPPADTLLTPAVPPLTLNLPSTAALSAVPIGGVEAAPSLALRDAAFALLARESLPGTPALGFPTGGALTPRPDSPLPAGPAAGQTPLDAGTTLLTAGSSDEPRAERGAVDLLDGDVSDEGGQAAVTDFFPPT